MLILQRFTGGFHLRSLSNRKIESSATGNGDDEMTVERQRYLEKLEKIQRPVSHQDHYGSPALREIDAFETVCCTPAQAGRFR